MGLYLVSNSTILCCEDKTKPTNRMRTILLALLVVVGVACAQQEAEAPVEAAIVDTTAVVDTTAADTTAQ